MLRPRRTLDVVHVPVVFLTDVFHQIFIGPKASREAEREWFGVCPRIIDRDLIDQRAEVLAGPAFDGMKLFGVRVPSKIEPEFVVVPDGIDHQRISVPAADRVSVPGWVRVLLMLAPIEEDLPK